MAPLTRAAAASTPRSPRALIVFDFDESLVDEDSDIFFLKSLCPQLLMEILASPVVTPEGHSELVDSAFTRFHERMPEVTREQMKSTSAKVPVSSKMLEAVKLAVDEHAATVVVASDANDFFIKNMLEHHGMQRYVSEIHANKAKWDKPKSARLRVRPYHAKSRKPHGCALCPRNLCKGLIIDALRKKQTYDLVLYVGDGKGDYCPATRLTSRDTVFARANDAKGRSFGLLEKIQSAPDKVAARVVEWHSGDDIFEQFRTALTAAKTSK